MTAVRDLKGIFPRIATPSHDGKLFDNYALSTVPWTGYAVQSGLPLNVMISSGESLITRWCMPRGPRRTRRSPKPVAEIALRAADYRTNFYGFEGQEQIPLNQIFEVHAGGAGLMLIARSVFARLDAAYPETRGRFPDACRQLVPNTDEMVEYFTFLTEAAAFRACSDEWTYFGIGVGQRQPDGCPFWVGCAPFSPRPPV